MGMYRPRAYQKEMIDRITEHPAYAIFALMGLGKTSATLAAVESLMYDQLQISRVLVIAPKRVAQTVWPAEELKWGFGLRIVDATGSAKEVKQALARPADVYCINRERVVWLIEEGLFNFDMVVIDESSSFKDPSTKRFKAIRKELAGVKRVVELTGTPAPKGYLDLWAQIYLLDRGARLGRTVTMYRKTYFTPGATNGHIVYDYKLISGMDKVINDKLADICVGLDSKDFIDLPKAVINDIEVEMDDSTKRRYKDFKKDLVMLFPDDGELTAQTAAVLSNKLRQFSSGAIYDDAKKVRQIHNLKIEALKEIVEEAQGENILLFCTFKHEYVRIKAKFPFARELGDKQSITDWQQGKIRLAYCHPASCGYGLNLQTGGHIIVWFGLTWSLEQYQQANARLARPGQTKTVVIHRIIMKNTVDEDCKRRLESNASVQDAFIGAVRCRILGV